MIKEKFYRILEQICPSDLAEDWDNSGLQLNSKYHDVSKVLVALEITDDVIDEALEKNADMIVANNLKVAGAGFAHDTNIVTLITKDHYEELPIMTKFDTANAIIDAALKEMGEK